MTFDEVVRFAHASNHALARAGTDNRARPLIELAWDDWRPFLEQAAERMNFTLPGEQQIKLDDTREMQLYGCIIRPKADTIPAALRASSGVEVKRMEPIVQAVAHIGVDFGFGPYELEEHFIEDARSALSQNKGE